MRPASRRQGSIRTVAGDHSLRLPIITPRR